jgi:hypothetical protein
MSNKRSLVISAAAVLAVVLIVAAVLAFSHSTKSAAVIPVTGGSKSAASPANFSQKIDLGGGYWLETDAQGGRIIPPATIIRPADQTFDMGDGYRLVITATGGQIVPLPAPRATINGQTWATDTCW